MPIGMMSTMSFLYTSFVLKYSPFQSVENKFGTLPIVLYGLKRLNERE
jgi:hypothetical protein